MTLRKSFPRLGKLRPTRSPRSVGQSLYCPTWKNQTSQGASISNHPLLRLTTMSREIWTSRLCAVRQTYRTPALCSYPSRCHLALHPRIPRRVPHQHQVSPASVCPLPITSASSEPSKPTRRFQRPPAMVQSFLIAQFVSRTCSAD